MKLSEISNFRAGICPECPTIATPLLLSLYKLPLRYNNGIQPKHQSNSAKEMFKAIYTQTTDKVISHIDNRFEDQNLASLMMIE